MAGRSRAKGRAKKQKTKKGKGGDDDDFEMDISEGAGANGEEDEDEFEMMDDGFDFGDEALGESVVFGDWSGLFAVRNPDPSDLSLGNVLAAAMDEFEKTPVSSKTTKKAPPSTSRLTSKAGESSRASQFTYDPSSSSTNTQKTPTRPPVRPLGSGSNKSAGKRSGLNSAGGGGSGGFITQAERSRLEAKEKKRAEEDCFEFLKDLRDVSRDMSTFLPLWASTLRRSCDM